MLARDHERVDADDVGEGERGRLEHGADIAKAKMRLLLDGRGHAVVGRDAELARAHQNAMTGRDFHAVAVARERRPDALRSDVFHGERYTSGWRWVVGGFRLNTGLPPCSRRPGG